MPTTPASPAFEPESDVSRDHWWWRPGWGPDTRCYTFHVTFGDQPGREVLHALAARLEEVTDRHGWDLIPRPWLHLTTQGVGLTDQVRPEQAQQVAHAARSLLAGTGPLTLRMGPPRVDAEGINLPVDQSRLDGVRKTLRQAIAQVLGAQGVTGPASWRAHVSLAYANTTGLELAPVRADLARHADATAVVKVDHVSLIELRRAGHLYRWEDIAAISLT